MPIILTAEARESLEKIKAAVLSHPSQVDMGEWVCGTTGCIAGWHWLLSVGYAEHIDPRADHIDSAFYHLLFPEEDLDNRKNTTLYHSVILVGHWPEKFQERIDGLNPTTEKYAQVVADRIQHLLDTGE